MSFTSSGSNFSLLSAEEQLETLRLNQLYRDWRQATHGTVLPGRDFLDPKRHGYLDGMLLVVDVENCEDDHCRYRYRSAGRHFIEALKVDPSGTYMDQHPEAEFAVQAMRACDLVVKSRRPIHARADRVIEGRQFRIEFLLLPVAEHDDAVSTILIAQIFTPLK
ncbi:PAS domain-containing protein [Ferrovibrio terrae]|uniref:PAS domain-containing protein n=1 Tax=Ferrovibrio terrae TaxID=2594003 RepID=A0A516GYW4_9PROT|nr:PAS domain-containing protein [Ferrovibrio terrae]QDO96697.1 PAS domain-containing protein [Ferrovibrio terrae]